MSRLVAALAGFALSVVIAAAHHSHRVKWEDVTVHRDRIILDLRYELSEPGFTGDVRERFDTDGDRRLSPDEARSLTDYAIRLAVSDLRLTWDGKVLEPRIDLVRTNGLERPLPSAYPIDLRIRLVFPVGAAGGTHDLAFADGESRWHSDFECRVRFGAGVRETGSPEGERSFDFHEGRGSFRIVVELSPVI